MPRAGQVQIAPGQRLTDRVALGVLTATFPRTLVDEVIAATGSREQRNRLLPAHLTVYYVLAMTLFSAAGYEEVMRSLTEGLSWASDGAERYQVASQVAITKARARLGFQPLAELFTRACVPLATEATPAAFYRGRRLLSLDGTTIDVADTAANAESFGRARTGRGDGSAFPQLRLVALGECGTHAIIAAKLDSYDVGEVSLAKDLLPAALRPGMLVLADRGFTAFPLWDLANATGADLLWRAKSNAVLPVIEPLPDGSFRSEIVATADKRTREQVRAVRVIEYILDDPGRPAAAGTRYRLLTTLFDPKRRRPPSWPRSTPGAGRSSPSSTNSRPINADPGWCCAPAPRPGSTRRPGDICACTTPSGPSSTPPPAMATTTPTGCPSPGPATPPDAASAPACMTPSPLRWPCAGPSGRSHTSCCPNDACARPPGWSDAR